MAMEASRMTHQDVQIKDCQTCSLAFFALGTHGGTHSRSFGLSKRNESLKGIYQGVRKGPNVRALPPYLVVKREQVIIENQNDRAKQQVLHNCSAPYSIPRRLQN